MRRSVALCRILCRRTSSSMSMSFSFCTSSSPVVISSTISAAEPTSIGMGNVTKQNFWSSLEAFKAQIAFADFVAVDLELTGIHSIPPSLPLHHSLTSSLPNPLQRSYHRLKHLAEKFAVVQVGVALFELHENLNKYFVHPYNFYVFPRCELPLDLPGATFSCEAAALEFLASHGFDFNLCIQEGVSYLSKTQEDEARLQLNQHVAFKDSSCACSRNSTSTSDFVFCARFRMELEKWTNKIKINNVNNNAMNIFHMHMVKEASTFRICDVPNLACYTTPQRDALSKYPNFIAELDNHHQVCLARGVVDRHFENLFPIVMSNCGSTGNHKISIIFTNTRNELENLQKEWTEGFEESKIKAAVGFRHIIDAIVSSQKPLIGHNCALDLAHIHHKFISSLPITMEEFSSSLLSNFPFIIDTKYLIKSEPSLRTSWARRHTSLNAVYSHFSKPKDIKYGAARYARSLNHLSHRASIEIIAGFKRYQDSDHTLLHEAGYDAFMTGSVFAQVCHQLQVNVKHLHSSNTSAITDYVNLLNLGSGILDLSTGKQKAKGDESFCYYNPSFASNIM